MLALDIYKGGVWSATGHRPDKLGGYCPQVEAEVVATARMAVTWAEPECVLVGMALGWDTAVAVACYELGVPYVACVPFEGQESRWRPEQQRVFNTLLQHARQVVHVSGPGYAPEKMELRNRYMVDNSSRVMAVWDGHEKGGTANCVRYARKRKPVFNWWGILRGVQRGEIDFWPWQSDNFPMEIPF